MSALATGTVAAANIFTTDPDIAKNGWVMLTDPKHQFLAANVVPVITKTKATPTVTAALNSVSAKLTTANLTEMLQKVVLDKQDPETVAKDFLTTNGLN